MQERSHADWVQRDAAVVWHGFTQMSTYADNDPIVVESGDGHDLIDVDGRRYLDAISSLWVTTLGHRVPELDAALAEQAGRVAHSTLLGNGNRAVIEFAEALAPRLPVDRPHLLFASDGAAAVEQALRIVFQFWTNQGYRARTSYLAFGGAYHGDTIGSLSVGASGFGTDIYDPLRFPVLRAPGYDDPDCMRVAIGMIEAHADRLAAVVLEPLVQGAAGVHLRPPAEFAALGRACEHHGIPVICDEVAVGFGRTGTLFASEQCGLRPDVLTLGKGITGGYLPLAVTAVNERIYETFLGDDLGPQTLYHGHSYGGNALAAAVALRHLELLDEQRVIEGVSPRAERLRELLDDYLATEPGVRAIRQHGLMAGIELAPPHDGLRWGRRVSAACVRAGVLIRPLGDVIIVVPHLNSPFGDLERIVVTVRDALRSVVASDASGSDVVALAAITGTDERT
jgi:adenosylmethionine-8-amino-7-oxononanoate aminotransferase